MNKLLPIAIVLLACLVGHAAEDAGLGGIGALLRKKEHIEIAAVAKNSPADRAGVRSWDHILQIDGKPTKNLELAEAVAAIRGPVNSKVRLMVLSVDQQKPRSLEVSRAVIDPKNIEWKKEVLITTEDGRRYIQEE